MKRVISCILIISFCILGIFCLTGCSNEIENTNIENKQVENVIIDNEEKEEIVEEDSNEIVRVDIEVSDIFNEALVDYIIASIKVYAEDGYILKDINGNVNTERLTADEVDSNYEEYKKQIVAMLSDETIFKGFSKDGKEYSTYNFQKILNGLGIGTHMGAGIGCYDMYGVKLYEYGKISVEKYPPTKLNIIKYFGFNKQELIDLITRRLKTDGEEGNIVKLGTQEKISENEIEKNIKEYEEKIINIIENNNVDGNLYYDTGRLYYSCNFTSFLKELDLANKEGLYEYGDNYQNFILY